MPRENTSSDVTKPTLHIFDRNSIVAAAYRRAFERKHTTVVESSPVFATAKGDVVLCGNASLDELFVLTEKCLAVEARLLIASTDRSAIHHGIVTPGVAVITGDGWHMGEVGELIDVLIDPSTAALFDKRRAA